MYVSTIVKIYGDNVKVYQKVNTPVNFISKYKCTVYKDIKCTG